jgi:hypothetical protein
MSQASDFGSLGMATEQASRMLKTYRKKLVQARETVDLDDLEDEVHELLRIINDRKGKSRSVPPLPQASKREEQDSAASPGRVNSKAAFGGEAEADQLAVLLERSNMADTAMTTAKGTDMLATGA